MTIRQSLRLLLGAACSLLPCGAVCAQEPQAAPDAVIVLGASGSEAYGNAFAEAADHWQRSFDAAGLRYCLIGGTDESDNDEATLAADDSSEKTTDASTVAEKPVAADDKTRLLERLIAWTEASQGRRWLVLIGHGTSNRQGSNFNLVGPDVSEAELRDALLDAGPAVVVCSFSSSGGWIPTLAAPERVVIAATKGPEEYNYSRFGGFFAAAVGNPDYDLDHDREVSLLEAFLAASRETERFYADEGRIASEHAILDDNGDGVGTTADFYDGLETVKAAVEGKEVDGRRAAGISLVPATSQPVLDADQLARRDTLETELRELRGRKASMPEDAYYAELERIFRSLAEVYASEAAPAAAE